jgi:hypothetical protein
MWHPFQQYFYISLVKKKCNGKYSKVFLEWPSS